MQETLHYDIVVIGSGPAGEKAAMQASKLKKQVALIEKLPRLGGASLHTGTVPSKSLRETVIHLALLRQQTHGIDINFKENLTTKELMYRKGMVIQDQESSLRRNFEKNHITVFEGSPRFLSPTSIEIHPADETEKYEITTDYTIIATGSSPRRPKWAPFDNECVFDSDTILEIKHLPKKVTIIGAGVIGCEYASIFSKMGIRVNLIARNRNILPFVDNQIVQNLMYQMRNQRVTLRLGENVEDIEKINSEEVHVKLESRKILPCSTVMVAAGRFANSGGMNLEKVGIELGSNGLIKMVLDERDQVVQRQIDKHTGRVRRSKDLHWRPNQVTPFGASRFASQSRLMQQIHNRMCVAPAKRPSKPPIPNDLHLLAN